MILWGYRHFCILIVAFFGTIRRKSFICHLFTKIISNMRKNCGILKWILNLIPSYQFLRKIVIVSIHKSWSVKLLKLCKKEEKLCKFHFPDSGGESIDLKSGGVTINTSK